MEKVSAAELFAKVTPVQIYFLFQTQFVVGYARTKQHAPCPHVVSGLPADLISNFGLPVRGDRYPLQFLTVPLIPARDCIRLKDPLLPVP
mmetsp:Transcript_37235/g.77913  ORF Transcript_37235/g.77913 Transcript_37235/m.77913 type:complete len:90 (+) Transcript_37235:7139-7408(+)